MTDDMEELRALNAEYALANDGRHHVEWASLFTTDGIFVSPDDGEIRGTADLVAHLRSYDAVLDGARIRHMITNVHITELSGDRARGSAYLAFFHTRDGETTISAVGEYRDEYRRVDGVWLFSRREARVDR